MFEIINPFEDSWIETPQNLTQRQVSIDVDGGVFVLEVPEKKQNKVWRVMSQYVRVVQKYLGFQTAENEANIGTGSIVGETISKYCILY